MSKHPLEQLTAPLTPSSAAPDFPPEWTAAERSAHMQSLRLTSFLSSASESCLFKGAISATAGFGLGAFFSLMSASMTYESSALSSTVNTSQSVRVVFKEMAKGMWSSGKSFGRIGAIFATVECCVEGYRARNDLWNGTIGGILTGAILARRSSPIGLSE